MGIRREHTRIVNGKIVPVQQAIIKDKASSDGLQTSKSFMLNNISIGPSEPEILERLHITLLLFLLVQDMMLVQGFALITETILLLFMTASLRGKRVSENSDF